MSLIYFIIAIGILILIHELGHFIMARRGGIRVEKFSIGFGPTLLKFKRGETEYRLAPIPIGGYVKMTGEEPDEDGALLDEKSFARKSVWTRIKVVAAGPIMNLVLALVLLPIVFMIGRMEPSYLGEPPVVMGVKANSPAQAAGLEKGDAIVSIDGSTVASWDDFMKTVILSGGKPMKFAFKRDGSVREVEISTAGLPDIGSRFTGIEPMFFLGNEAVIDKVSGGGAAYEAGIKSGDRVLAVNGTLVTTWTEMSDAVQSLGGQKLSMTIDRDGEKFEIELTPKLDRESGRYLIGVVKGMKPSDVPMTKHKYSLIPAIKKGVDEFGSLVGLTGTVLKKLVTLQLSYKSLGGPIQIAQASASAAKYGAAEFIYFLAFLSIQLGILNLLPIPVLDGGHIVFFGIEAVFRKPLPVKVRAVAQYIGLGVILTLLFFVTMNDLENVWGIKRLLGKWF